MCNIDDALSLTPQSADNGKQFFRLFFADRRCGFVHNDNIGIQGDCFCYFHQLLFSDAKILQFFGRLHLYIQHFQILFRLLQHGLKINGSAFCFPPSKKDILRNTQFRHDLKLLMDLRDSQLFGCNRIRYCHFFPV